MRTTMKVIMGAAATKASVSMTTKKTSNDSSDFWQQNGGLSCRPKTYCASNTHAFIINLISLLPSTYKSYIFRPMGFWGFGVLGFC